MKHKWQVRDESSKRENEKGLSREITLTRGGVSDDVQ